MATTVLTRMGAEKGATVWFQHQLHHILFRQYNRKFHESVKCFGNVTRSTPPGLKSYDDIPGPSLLTIISNFWRYLPIIGTSHDLDPEKFHHIMHAQYGDLVRMRGIPGRGDMLFAFHPEDVETIYRNEGPWPNRGKLNCIEYYQNVHRKDSNSINEGLTSRDGPSWLETRRKVNPVMMQPRTSNRYIPQISEVAQEFIERLQLLRDDNNEVPPDFINELCKWSLESITYIVLDTRLGCLAPNLAPDSELQKIINAVDIFFDSLFHLESGIPIWKIFPTSRWKKFASAMDFYRDVSIKHIEAAIERQRQGIEDGNEINQPSILQRLLATMNSKSASLVMSEIIFSGVDTTSHSVVMAIYELSKNQKKQEILFQELKKYLPNKNTVITEDKIEDMKYLKSCIKESARTRPIFTGNMRITVTDTVLSNYRVPKGVPVFMPNTISLQSEEFFPMSNKFIPERWLKKRPGNDLAGSTEDFDEVFQRRRQNYFSFLPFGFGARSCVGKRFAQLEIEILLAKIIRNFHVEYNYGDLQFRTKLLRVPKDPVRFKMVERKE